jgi:hypothetical protein
MANTLTSLAPVIYAGTKDVAREMTGIIPSLRLDFDTKGMAQGSTVVVPVAPTMSKASVTPAQVFTVGSNRTASSKSVTLANYEEVKWHLTGEEERALMNGGTAQEFFRQTMAQAWRTLINAIELNAWTKCYKGSSRATGTAGTTPFASTLTDLTAVRKILVDNGVSVNAEDCSIILDSTAGVKLRNLTQLQKVNEAGSGNILRDGALGDLFGFRIRESAQIGIHTKGTQTGLDPDGISAVGDTSLALAGGDGGSLLSGDVITFAADSANKYVVGTGFTAASGTAVLNDPGIRVEIAAGSEITTGGNYTANLALHRNAAALVVRPAIQPAGAIAEQMVVTDAVTGLSALLLRVPGDSLVSYYLRVVHDCSVINSHEIATILG